MKKQILAGTLAATLLVGITGCTTDEYNDRKTKQSTSLRTSLEVTNLKEKLARENQANQIRYLYLMSFGKIIGYYVTKGKISSNGSQVAPEQEIICRYSGDSCQAVDSSQDDGSYGQGDPGIFFFTTDGTMVVTSLDYIQSDTPLKIDVPRLDGAK